MAMTHPHFGQPHEGHVYYWKYWNCYDEETDVRAGMYFVAVVDLNPTTSEPFQWACYAGISIAGAQHEAAGVMNVARHGEKINEANARYLFPHLKDIEWRD